MKNIVLSFQLLFQQRNMTKRYLIIAKTILKHRPTLSSRFLHTQLFTPIFPAIHVPRPLQYAFSTSSQSLSPNLGPGNKYDKTMLLYCDESSRYTSPVAYRLICK